MDKMFTKLKQEPLFGFFLFGFVLYLLYNYLNPPKTTTNIKQEIIIPKSSLTNTTFDKNTTFILERYKKVLLEESYFLELYKQDKQIQKLLLQKEEQLLQNGITLKEPTQEELYLFFQKYKQNYLPIQKATFYTLPIQEKKTPHHLNLFELIPKTAQLHTNLTKEERLAFCGTFFEHKLQRLGLKTWSEPIQCNNTLITFIITKITPTTQNVEFEAVQDRVYKDYLQKQQQKALQQAFKNLLNNYNVKVQ